MALDPNRTRAECAWKDCPFDAKVIDLTAGGFVEVGSNVFHASCYAASRGEQATPPAVKAARDADAALDAKVAAVRRKREEDALAASAADQARLSGQLPTGSAVDGNAAVPAPPGRTTAQGASGVAPLVTDSVAQPAIPG